MRLRTPRLYRSTSSALLVLFGATACIGGGDSAGVGVSEEAVYVPPVQGAAFGIPGTPPSVAVNGLLTAQAVGRLPGSGGVTPDGAYSYTLPLSVPPGRGGMEPAAARDVSSSRSC